MSKSLLTRLRMYLLIPKAAILVLAGIFWFLNLQESNNYSDKLHELLNKRNILNQVQDNFESEVSELRGYIGIRSPLFLHNFYDRQRDVNHHLDEYSLLPLDTRERAYIADMKKGIGRYNSDNVPRVIRLTQANNNEQLRKNSDNGATNFINGLRTNLDHQMASYTYQINQLEKTHQTYRTDSLGGFLVILAVILLLSFWIVNRFGKDIGGPISKLTNAANRLAKGEYLPVPPLNRSDELGQLERAFNKMLKDLEFKKSQLLSHNQELAAHQEELYAQQLELEETVAKLMEKDSRLGRRNQLSTSLATEIEVKSMLVQILDSMLSLTASQIGMITTLKGTHVSRGLADEQVNTMLTGLYSGMSGRAIAEKSILALARPCSPLEQDHHNSYSVNDVFVPLKNRENEVIALLVLTRLTGITFSESEMSELQALAQQISLAIDNAVTYTRTREQSRIHQSILNAAAEGIALINPKGVITSVNHAWCDIYGFDSPEASMAYSSMEIKDIVHKKIKNPDEVFAFLNHVMSGQMNELQEIVFEMTEPSHRVMRMYHRHVLSENGDTLGWLIVSRDITREYEIDRMKSEFVSTVSHELRTPLSSILGFVEIMLQRTLSADKQTRFLNTIYREARRLTNLINDFLDVQRMESGHQEYDKSIYAIRDIVKDVIDMHQSPSHKIVVDLQTKRDTIQGDREKIQQVISNLLNNAVKYSPEGGEIRILIENCETKPQDLCIHVKDQGLGIPQKSIPHLFEKFYRVDNSDRRKIGGTGLGLSICAEIVKAHNGSIQVHSQLGEGSTFTVVLPSYSEAEAADSLSDRPEWGGHPLLSDSAYQTAAAATETIYKGHILIVEDDESLSIFLAEELGNSLTQKGIDIKRVRTGEEALKSIEESTPLLVILDIMLGNGKDGWEIIQEITAEEPLHPMPIVISSALEEKEKSLGFGVADYLIKPYPAEKLTTTVCNLIESAHREAHIFIPEKVTNVKD
ncbi:ATP-binding protein [Aneurinibacillus sp. Ricciae_BoGa-3]|uniref:ATP-binding protein n=1 Tax=Aneurinibacillus sp. Ricciae_BoGa-3 TaxID=3022697 RepID=UPI002342646B|nr:ATP-binding protein [Aneurinibacillus sp. Ricciae_BoGa-3]WCK55827.1 ATP-binding protein [Aneurinibacillus sp. Ricciae_BoGa-3]